MAWSLIVAVVTVHACVGGLRVAAATARARRVGRRRGPANPRIDLGSLSSDWLTKQRMNREGFRRS
jgi:hypothetical protein